MCRPSLPPFARWFTGHIHFSREVVKVARGWDLSPAQEQGAFGGGGGVSGSGRPGLSPTPPHPNPPPSAPRACPTASGLRAVPCFPICSVGVTWRLA